MSMMNGDPFDSGTPKYSTATDIYDALCEMSTGEEIGILGEMFSDVSWDGQDYYYTDNAGKLVERWDQAADYGNKMWLMDLAVWQIDQGDIHDFVWEALRNDAMAKRTGFKKLFIDDVLRGHKPDYVSVTEAWLERMEDLDRFDLYSMRGSLQTVLNEHGHYPTHFPYNDFCGHYYEKLAGLQLQKETNLIAQCRAMLTSYDDFMFGLRSNQALYQEQERMYQSKVAQLQGEYEKAKQLLLTMAQEQGVVLQLPDKPLMIEGARKEQSMLTETCVFCGQQVPHRKPTNADRIRAMSDEELAKERVEFNYNPSGSDYYSGDFGHVNIFYNNGVMQPEAYQEALRKELDWLRTAAEEAE